MGILGAKQAIHNQLQFYSVYKAYVQNHAVNNVARAHVPPTSGTSSPVRAQTSSPVWRSFPPRASSPAPASAFSPVWHSPCQDHVLRPVLQANLASDIAVRMIKLIKIPNLTASTHPMPSRVSARLSAAACFTTQLRVVVLAALLAIPLAALLLLEIVGIFEASQLRAQPFQASPPRVAQTCYIYACFSCSRSTYR